MIATSRNQSRGMIPQPTWFRRLYFVVNAEFTSWLRSKSTATTRMQASSKQIYVNSRCRRSTPVQTRLKSSNMDAVSQTEYEPTTPSPASGSSPDDAPSTQDTAATLATMYSTEARTTTTEAGANYQEVEGLVALAESLCPMIANRHQSCA